MFEESPRLLLSNLDQELESSLENEEISETLLEYCEKCRQTFIHFEDMSMEEKDILSGLKLFSASDTCSSLLENSIIKLKQSKKNKENPKSLEELRDILEVVIDIGKKLSEVFEYKGFKESNIRQIRDISLDLQEEAEDRGLLESLSERIKKIPNETRVSIMNRFDILVQH